MHELSSFSWGVVVSNSWYKRHIITSQSCNCSAHPIPVLIDSGLKRVMVCAKLIPIFQHSMGFLYISV